MLCCAVLYSVLCGVLHGVLHGVQSGQVQTCPRLPDQFSLFDKMSKIDLIMDLCALTIYCYCCSLIVFAAHTQ